MLCKVLKMINCREGKSSIISSYASILIVADLIGYPQDIELAVLIFRVTLDSQVVSTSGYLFATLEKDKPRLYAYPISCVPINE